MYSYGNGQTAYKSIAQYIFNGFLQFKILQFKVMIENLI